ncbi:hypothetical protein BdWA1_001308 [Babesia duncani]|uniref:Uncharacterized protein n=1 Tax=Babesia duncani TaxID=323732 RepID=A0AAD9UQV8_9APIC|nr:hypothetical protein BdWA1_001308 [Babesia duncani]
MDLNINGPFNELQPEHLNVLDDVVKSFSESLDSVLRTNFKPQKRPPGQANATASNAPITTDASITKNQRLAAVFCRQWLTGALNELTRIFAQEEYEASEFDTCAMTNDSHLVNVPELSNPDLGVYVENARICGNGQIEVNYDISEPVSRNSNSSKLKAQELMQLLYQGKETEFNLEQKLVSFWRNSPQLIMQLVKQDPEYLSPQECNDTPQESLNVDFQAIEELDKLINNKESTGSTGNSISGDDDISRNLELLKQQANDMDLVGVNELVKLYRKLKKEIAHVSKMAAFFSNFVNDLAQDSVNNQIDIM